MLLLHKILIGVGEALTLSLPGLTDSLTELYVSRFHIMQEDVGAREETSLKRLSKNISAVTSPRLISISSDLLVNKRFFFD